MKVIFLDIDGVLNSDRSMVANGPMPNDHLDTDAFSHQYLVWMTDPIAVKLLNRAVREAGAKMVISSTNRMMGHTKCVEALRAMGVEGEFIGSTPVINADRGVEIQDWLNSWKAGGGEEITHYAIIDDDGDMLDHQMPHFVHVNGRVGITHADYEKLKEVLGIDPGLLIAP